MRRRTFVGMLGAAAVPFAWSHRARGQPPARAAIVIGVDQCRGLPKLKAAATGARQFARWLGEEGFLVKEFIDDQGPRHPVLAERIYESIDELVELGTLEQLVVYFSGHGFLIGTSEHWMLSQAPSNPNQSVIQTESALFARRLGIPHVVFISDACRSTTASLGAQSMKGYVIFPSPNEVVDGPVHVDQFYATGAGNAALELPVNKSVENYEGIYTSVFLSAFGHPYKTMVHTMDDGLEVVPNSMLEDYLIQETRSRAQAHSINLTQSPDSRIESRVPAYIGHVRARGTISSDFPRRDAPRPAATLSDVAAFSLMGSGLEGIRPNESTSSIAVAQLARESGFVTTRSTVLMAVSPTANVPRRFETRTGVAVSGARVNNAILGRGTRMELLERGNGTTEPAIIRLGNEPSSVAIRFDDRSGTVIAAIPQFIATVVVKEGSVLDVSYLPSEDGQFSYDPRTMQRLSELRAAVAASAQFGAFRIKGEPAQREEQAKELADRIRALKGLDPTLGVYAAYAYADVGLAEHVASVWRSMRAERDFDLFDVAMLHAALTDRDWPEESRAFPVCPMLTQGWSLIRACRTALLSELETARGFLKQSLWTTFDPPGMDIIERLIRRTGR